MFRRCSSRPVVKPAPPTCCDAVACTPIHARLGAVHVQLGKLSPYRAMVSEGAWSQLTAIKRVFDPNQQLNPGNLGFDG